MYSQLCWAKKDWNCAITKAEGVKTAMGAKVKPKVFKQLAYSYLGKGDFANAKTNVDEFFERTKEGFLPADYQLKADIYTGGGATCEEVYALYMQGAAADSILQNKIDFMTKAADFLKQKNVQNRKLICDGRFIIREKVLILQVLINIGILFSQAGDFKKADTLLAMYIH